MRERRIQAVSALLSFLVAVTKYPTEAMLTGRKAGLAQWDTNPPSLGKARQQEGVTAVAVGACPCLGGPGSRGRVEREKGQKQGWTRDSRPSV